MFKRVKKHLFAETENQTHPPESLSPPLVARLLSVVNQQKTCHLTAIPFDLAERGYLQIAQREEDVIFTQTDKPAEKLPHLFEQLFLKDMFGLTGYMPFQQLGPRLSGMRRSLDTHIAKEAAVTKLGDKAAWRGFRSYLERSQSGGQVSEFGRYLPYAIAFGVDIEWGTRFADRAKGAQPHWYETPEPAGAIIEILRIARTMSHQLDTAAVGVSIPFDKESAADSTHPIGQGVLVVTTPGN